MEVLGGGSHGNMDTTNQNKNEDPTKSSPVKVDDASKSSTTDASTKLHDQKSSNENSPSKDTDPDQIRSSWQQLFGEIPHSLIPAKESDEYTQKIYDLLHDNLDGSRNRGNTKGGLSKDPDPSSGGTVIKTIIKIYFFFEIQPFW